MRFWLIFCLSLLAHGAIAADWWFVPWNGDQKVLMYIDKSSLEFRDQNDELKGLIWRFYREDQTLETKSYRSDKIYLGLVCDKKLFHLSKRMYYSSYANLVAQFKMDSNQWQTIEAETLEETMANFMCSAGKKPPRSIPVYDPIKDFEQRFIQRDRERPSISVQKPILG